MPVYKHANVCALLISNVASPYFLITTRMTVTVNISIRVLYYTVVSIVTCLEINTTLVMHLRTNYYVITILRTGTAGTFQVFLFVSALTVTQSEL